MNHFIIIAGIFVVFIAFTVWANGRLEDWETPDDSTSPSRVDKELSKRRGGE